MNLHIVLYFLVLVTRSCYGFFWSARPGTVSGQTFGPIPGCPSCKTNSGNMQYEKAQFAFVGKVVALDFVPHVPPTGYSSIIVKKIKECKGFGTPTVRINTQKVNKACPQGSGGAFDLLISGRQYLFFGTYERLAPDNRLSFVVDKCGHPCVLRKEYKGTCPNTISNAICRNY